MLIAEIFAGVSVFSVLVGFALGRAAARGDRKAERAYRERVKHQ